MTFNESNKNKKRIYASAAQPYTLPSLAESTHKPKLDKEYNCQAEKMITQPNKWEYEQPLKATTHPKLLILPRPLGFI